MEQLFKFILTRPPQKVDTSLTTIPLRVSDKYHVALAAARASEAPIPEVRRTAGAYRDANKNWKPPTDVAGYDALLGLEDTLGGKDQISLKDLNAALTKAGLAGPYVGDKRFGPAFERVSDELVTTTVLGEEVSLSAYDASRLLRAMSLAERAAASDKSLEAPRAMANAFSRTLLLPGDVFPLTGKLAPTDDQTAADDAEQGRLEKELSDLLTQRATLVTAHGALTRITPDQLAEPEIPKAAAPAVETRAGGGVSGNLADGKPIGRTLLLLKKGALDSFTAPEKEALTKLSVDPSKAHILTSVDFISAQLKTVEESIAEKLDSSDGGVFLLGGTFHAKGKKKPKKPIKKPDPFPSTHGSLTPVGIGDLLVVKQFLKRYEAREEAHIENILKGEYKELKTTRTDVTEETTSTDITTTKEEQRDQQTTERFEMKTEASTVIKEDSSLKAGVSVSGSYGPMVEFKASTDFALNNSKEESKKVGTDYSKEVTNKASSKISESVRTQHILKITNTFVEENTHGFDNKAGADSVIGQYQWVDKVYEAQVFNYGKRLLYDLILPEPAAFLIYASSQKPKAEADLVKPDPFTLSPNDLSEWNYGYYVKKYGVVGVDAPPQPYVSIGKSLEGKGVKDDTGTGTKTAEIPIPDGYQALNVTVINAFTLWDASGAVDVLFGTNAHRFVNGDSWSWWTSLNNEAGSIPAAIKVFQTDVFATTFDVTCQRTQRALDEWKLKTHGSILQAYQKMLRDYQEALASLQVQQSQIQGRNPVENEKLIRTELKKGAISMFTDQQYDWLNAISTSLQGYPQVNVAEASAEGRYIRFFEQAFEWEQMMFFYYPYYWGRKNYWTDHVLLDDTDPLFADFIKAGAVRVVVSVRKGFEPAVAYFLQTGQIWNGADLPTISDPLYVSIIEEIKERDQAPGDETPQGDPWDVRLPTTLVYLRKEATLPSWHKDATGTWIPD